MVLREGRWPPALSRSDRRPSHLRQHPWVSFGTGRCPVTLNRTVARLPVAWTRQVTVTHLICGVDVSSTSLDACIGQDRRRQQRFRRDPDGIAALAAFCAHHQVRLVAMEATGGYERLPFALLWAAGIPAAIVNPRSVRRFAEGMGLLEKTDRIDAQVIAWYAEVKRITAQAPPSDAQSRLAALVTRLRQLTDLRVAQANQRRLVDDPDVLASIDAAIAFLARDIRAFEARIAELIATDPLWRKLDAAFRSIKGVADRTVARLMAEMPEIGTLSGKAVSKLAGLAPIAHDSGKRTGKRPVRGGREGVRSILVVVGELVSRHDPDFAAFRRRLVAAHKPKLVIRVALAHKLLVRLNAKARDVRNEVALAA
jgi:transposase